MRKTVISAPAVSVCRIGDEVTIEILPDVE
jgi:hypothetical protein